MNKEKLEILFQKKFFVEKWNIQVKDYVEIKQFIFETIIPEVLKSLIYPNWWLQFSNWRFIWEEEIKQKAKELYWIDL